MKFGPFTCTTLGYVSLALPQNLFQDWQSITAQNVQLGQTSCIFKAPQYQSKALTLLLAELTAANCSPVSPPSIWQCGTTFSSRHLLLTCLLLATPHQKLLQEMGLHLDWDLLVHTSPNPKVLLSFMRSACLFKGTAATSLEQWWDCPFQNAYDIWSYAKYGDLHGGSFSVVCRLSYYVIKLQGILWLWGFSFFFFLLFGDFVSKGIGRKWGDVPVPPM